jgi:hypothetical protein
VVRNAEVNRFGKGVSNVSLKPGQRTRFFREAAANSGDPGLRECASRLRLDLPGRRPAKPLSIVRAPVCGRVFVTGFLDLEP